MQKQISSSNKVFSSAMNRSQSVQHAIEPVFITLAFENVEDHPMIDHNCVRLSQNGYQYEIYTDDLSESYCSVCSCIQFVPSNCTCPQPTEHGCELCEKLSFIQARLTDKHEFVFLDSDLIILREDFMPALKARMTHFDFLASYGFGNNSLWHYSGNLNSGLFFMRRLQKLDYRLLTKMMFELNNNNDQNILSAFVRKFYRRWDSLSLQWHCRYLFRAEHDIRIENCFTFHGRDQALASAMKGGQFSLLRTQR